MKMDGMEAAGAAAAREAADGARRRCAQLYMGRLYAVMPLGVRRLIMDYGTAADVFTLSDAAVDALWYLKESQKSELRRVQASYLREIDTIGRGGAACVGSDADRTASGCMDAGGPASSSGIESELTSKGIGYICVEDAAYPDALRSLSDWPYLLYYRGRMPDPSRRCVAIIGARNCSDYGRRTAAYYGRELAVAGVAVVSGMAVGVDGLAQNACLAAGGESYAVLGSGVDVVYPKGNRPLYQQLAQQGGILSEYLPGTQAIAQNFPRRNRIISALADLVLVVEARERSGTLITVGCALEQGREVYAVPGRIEDVLSAGCNRLIRDGAGCATCAEDVLYALGIGEGTQHSGRGRCGQAPNGADGEDTRGSMRSSSPLLSMPTYWAEGMRPRLYRLLRERAQNAQDLYSGLGDAGVGIQELLAELMQMEIEGLVLCTGGVYSIR